MLEVTGGEYEEELTAKDISLTTGQALYALQNYTAGQSLSTAITYYTTLATGLAESLVRLGMKPPDAIEEANARLRSIVGFDTRSVTPTDILDPDSISVAELEYGFATAALSSLTERASILNDSEPHRIFTSVRFIQAAYEDVRADGVLNGRGGNGDVVFGRIRLNPQIYRHELALHILRIANNKTANRTGRGPREVFDLARRLNNSTDPIFGGDPVIPIDGDKPNVSTIVAREFPNLPNGAVVFGGLSLSAMVTTFPGAASTELLLDDKVIGVALEPENPTVLLDTLNPSVQEGRRRLKFRVTDISGAVGESPPLEVNVSNQQTAIENISIDGQLLGKGALAPIVTADIVDPAGPKMIRYSVKPFGASAFTPLVTITTDVAAPIAQSMARVDLAQAMPADGDATFKVEVTNSVGFTFAKEVPFAIDITEPMVSIPGSIMLDASNSSDLQGQYIDEASGLPCMSLEPADPNDSCLLYVRKAFDVATTASDNRELDSVALMVDGRPIGLPFIAPEGSTAVEPTFTVDPMTLVPSAREMRDGQKTVTVTAVDKARNSGSDTRQIIVDTTPPTLLSPVVLMPIVDANAGFIVDGEIPVVKGTFDISARVQDNLGFSATALLFDGAPIATGVVNQSTTVDLAFVGFNTASRPDGLHVLSVAGSDRAGNQLLSSAQGSAITVQFDNTAPVLSLDRFNLGQDFRCTMAGDVSDLNFQSLRFSTSSGFSEQLLSGSGAFTIDIDRSRDFTLEATDIVGNRVVLNGRHEYTMTFSGSGQSGPGLITTTCTVFIEGRRVFRREIFR